MNTTLDKHREKKVDDLFRAFKTVTDGSYLYVCDVKYDYSRWSADAIESFDLPGEYMFHAGQLWEALLHPDDRESYAESIAAIFSGSDGGHDMQYRVMDRQGRYVVCTCRGTVLPDGDGAPDYFVGTIHNNGLENSADGSAEPVRPSGAPEGALQQADESQHHDDRPWAFHRHQRDVGL